MVLRIKNRHRLKEREAKKIISSLNTMFGLDFFDATTTVDVGTLEEFTVVLVDDSVDFFYYHDKIVPTVQGVNKYQLKTHGVTVDMGAIGFITKGADVMAPGIREADQGIKKDDIVWICDETHHKPFAVGIALMNGDEMKMSQAGKAIKTLHYVGDHLWSLTHQ